MSYKATRNKPSPLAACVGVTLDLGDGKSITVNIFEMTPAQVRAWMVAIQSGDIETDVVRDFGTDGEPTIGDLMLMCDADQDDLESVPERCLDKVKEAAKKLNPGFFARKAVVSAAMQSIVSQMLSEESKQSSAPA